MLTARRKRKKQRKTGHGIKRIKGGELLQPKTEEQKIKRRGGGRTGGKIEKQHAEEEKEKRDAGHKEIKKK
jgi:hypothetical protein